MDWIDEQINKNLYGTKFAKYCYEHPYEIEHFRGSDSIMKYGKEVIESYTYYELREYMEICQKLDDTRDKEKIKKMKERRKEIWFKERNKGRLFYRDDIAKKREYYLALNTEPRRNGALMHRPEWIFNVNRRFGKHVEEMHESTMEGFCIELELFRIGEKF